MSIELDETDPCGTAAKLRETYTNLIGGGGASRITIRAGVGGTEKTLEYHRGDAAMLLREVQRWEGLCAIHKGETKPRRFAARAGGIYPRRRYS